VDYIHRSFVAEMAASGMADAAARLAECVKGTARKFGLGLDWMNSDADIALPYAFE
jgi:glycine cleavage system regulatory protein